LDDPGDVVVPKAAFPAKGDASPRGAGVPNVTLLPPPMLLPPLGTEVDGPAGAAPNPLKPPSCPPDGAAAAEEGAGEPKFRGVVVAAAGGPKESGAVGAGDPKDEGVVILGTDIVGSGVDLVTGVVASGDDAGLVDPIEGGALKEGGAGPNDRGADVAGTVALGSVVLAAGTAAGFANPKESGGVDVLEWACDPKSDAVVAGAPKEGAPAGFDVAGGLNFDGSAG